MIPVIALCGKSSSGKDTVLKDTVSRYPHIFHPIVSCTTRPIRDNEIEGEDYQFLTIEVFIKKVLDGEMLEATEFNGWFYGTPVEALNEKKINIGVFNLAGIEALRQDNRINLKVIEIWSSDKERLIRALNREKEPNCAEICRRYFADEKDWAEMDEEDEPDYIIMNTDEAPLWEQGGLLVNPRLDVVCEDMWEDTKACVDYNSAKNFRANLY